MKAPTMKASTMNTSLMRTSVLGLALAAALGGWHGIASAAGAVDPAALVARLDTLRRPAASNLRMDFTLTTSDGGTQDTYRYTGLIRKDAGTLVLAQDGDQRGQKYLYTPGGYWLYAPRTRRPMRLTPLQTLRGQASIGDISRLNLADDYNAAFAPQDAATVDGRECWVLALTAKSPEATYAAITLYVAKADQVPVQAELMAGTGRKLKTLKFGGLKKVGGQNLLTTFTYIDAVNPDRRTVQQINAVESAGTAAAMFQSQALALDN
jgi:hypothetical protein